MEPREITAENIGRVRKRLGITHSELAEGLGINRTALYLYERGKRIFPTELLFRLYEKYGIEPNEVLGIVKD